MAHKNPTEDLGKTLVRELKSVELFPPYNAKKVAEIASEICIRKESLVAALAQHEDLKKDKSLSMSVSVDNKCMDRAKRAVMIYLGTRLDRLHNLCWETSKILPETIKGNLSKQEIKYFEDYSKLLDDYNKSLKLKSLNLFSDLQPPKELYLEVRILKECGELCLPITGMVTLQRNTTIYLPRADVDHLIRQGIAEEI